MLPWALPGNKDGIMDVLTITNHPLKQIMSLESPVAPTMKKMKAASLVFITRLHTPNYYYFGCWGWNVDGMAHGKPIFKMITIAPLWEREIGCWMSTSLGLPKQFSNFFSSCLTLTFQANSLFDRSSLHHNFFSVTLQFAFFSRISHFVVVVVVHMYNIVLQMLFNTF